MATAARRRGVSPSLLDSPSIAHSAVRKDVSYLGHSKTAGLMDVAPPLTPSQASLITEPAHAVLLSRPRSPVDHRTGSSSSFKDRDSQHPLQSQISSNDHTKDWAQSKATIASRKAAPYPAKKPNAKEKAANRATERSFYRRLLFQDLPSSEDAPAITSDPELDHEIYLLFAYLLRETVLPWYIKLTPDRELLTQVTAILVTILHLVAARLSSEDGVENSAIDIARIHTLLCEELPLVLRQHFADYRSAIDKVGSIWAPLATHSVTASAEYLAPSVERNLAHEVHDALATEVHVSSEALAQLYHNASPHPGINAIAGNLDGKIELSYMRIATLSLLSSILPADEFTPETERFIVRDVLVSVLRGVIAKSTRPWFITQIFHKGLDSAGWNDGYATARETNNISETTTSLGSIAGIIARFTTLMIRFWSLVVLTVLPLVVRMYLSLFSVQYKGSHQRHRSTGRGESQMNSSISRSWSMGSLSEKRMHGRFPSELYQRPALSYAGQSSEAEADKIQQSHCIDQPAYFAAWMVVLEEALDSRSSALLNSTFSLAKVSLGMLGLDHQLDTFIMATINTKATNHKYLTRLVRKISETLLPGGHLSPAMPDPEYDAQVMEWIRLRVRIVHGMPQVLRKGLLGNDFTTQFQTVTRWLAPLCAPQAAGPNTFLGIMVFERTLVMLCPDMVES